MAIALVVLATPTFAQFFVFTHTMSTLYQNRVGSKVPKKLTEMMLTPGARNYQICAFVFGPSFSKKLNVKWTVTLFDMKTGDKITKFNLTVNSTRISKCKVLFLDRDAMGNPLPVPKNVLWSAKMIVKGGRGGAGSFTLSLQAFPNFIAAG